MQARLARRAITSPPRRCGGALDIQSPGRPRGTTASAGYGVSDVHVTGNSKYQATGISSDQEAHKTASLSLTVHVLRVQHYCAF